jgi:hypothetical protein
MKTSFVLLLLLIAAGGQGVVALAQSPGTFSVTGRMTTPRAGHTATLLTSGKVLVAGGAREIGFGSLILATAELYDPSTGAFIATGNMTMPRTWHSATLLPDGRVLISGGINDLAGQIPSNGAEIYDPSTGTFAATGSMIGGHRCHQATLLGNGKVLIAGGSVPGSPNRVPNAELYDPATGTFAATGTYVTDTNVDGLNTCQGAESTLLPDGRVLIIFESHDAELYDPYDGAFTRTRGNPIARGYHEGLPTATLLMNGKVLVAGNGWLGSSLVLAAELYDSGTGTFTATGNMITAHAGHRATLLPDGTVLLAGSFLFGSLANAELYDPVKGAFTATSKMITAGGSSTATLLNNGQILITGGHSAYTGGPPGPATTSNAEIYHPVVLVPAPQLFSVSGDGRGQGAILHAGTARVVTASDPAIPGEVLEIYGTGLKDDSVIPPQVAIGGRLAEILYFGNAPGFTGLNQVNVRVPGGVAPGAGVPVRLTYLGRPSNAVNIGVQ